METVGVYPLVPLPGRQIPAESQRKTFRPLGTNTLTQFEYSAQPVLKKAAARKGRSAYAPRAPSKASAEGKRKATHFREWLLVEVTGLEPVTRCRLADDEPGCNREKEKALTFVSA